MKMALSAYEKSVVTELLSGVDEGDLIQLAKTVSQKFIKVGTGNRALDIILLHSPSVDSILTRKKISKQLLFNYLHYKQVPVQPHLSKDEIIQKLLSFWKQNAITLTSEATTSAHVQSSDQLWNNSYNYSESNPSTLDHFGNTPPAPPSQDLVHQSQELHHAHQNSQDNQLVVSNINVEELGSEFTKWFSGKFNACNATSDYTFDSTMFFSNATAEFRIVRNVNGQDTVENSNTVENSYLIGQTFSELQRVYNLYLNINLDSLKVSKNSYGNILIGSCGSLHSASQLVGVYEQLFQLFHDPLCTLSDRPVWKVQKLLFNCKFANSCPEIESGQFSQSSGMAEIEYDVSYGDS